MRKLLAICAAALAVLTTKSGLGRIFVLLYKQFGTEAKIRLPAVQMVFVL